MRYSETRTIQVSAYRHKLNSMMIKSLIKVVDEYKKTGEAVNVLKLEGLTTNQINNFQKMKHWNLIVSPEKGAGWIPTRFAMNFLKGLYAIYDVAASLDNETLPYDHRFWKLQEKQPVSMKVHEFFEQSEYDFYKDYPGFAAEKVPERQQQLF